jgi:hypothetical protein
MKFEDNVRKILLRFLAFFALIFWFTYGITKTFFQQDEWNGFGLVIGLAQQSWLDWFGLLSPSHFIPLAQFVWFAMYKIFGFEAQYYAWAALVLHAIASVLVYRLGEVMTRNKWIGLLAAVLFATNFRSAQAFTHMAIFPATLTGFIVIISFLLYLFTRGPKKFFTRKDAVVLSGLFLLSMMFREDGLILPPLLLAFVWLFQRNAFNRKNVWFFMLFFGIVLGFAVFRVLLQLSNPHAIAISGGSAYKVMVYNALSLPFKLVVQNVAEGIELFNLFWANKARLYTEYHHQITIGLMYTVVYDFAILATWVVLAVCYFVLSLGKKSETYWPITSLALIWIVLSAGLLSLVGRPHNVVESRYLYLTSFPVMLLLSQVVIHAWSTKYWHSIFRLITRVGIVIFLIVFSWWSYRDMQITIDRYERQAQARMSILRSLTALYPTVPKYVALYVQCRGECKKNIDLVGVPNTYVLPFTSGPGWIFMLQYAKQDESSFAPLFSRVDGKEFLWDLGAQGYREIQGRGFGYFVSKDLLFEVVKKHSLTPGNVIGLEYDESTFTLHDISDSLRAEVAKITAR